MNNNMKELSKEGEEFIIDLKFYLLNCGRSDEETQEFIEEAQEHLILGEKEGKTVEDIFGSSPEEYAKSVSKEIGVNKKEILSVIFLFIFGITTWVFFSKIDNGKASFSYLEIISTPIVYLVTLAALIIINKKLTFKEKAHIVALFILFLINIISLVVIGFINTDMKVAFVMNRTIVNTMIILLFIVSIFISRNINTYISILPFVCYIDTIIFNFTNVYLIKDDITRTIFSWVLCFAFIILEIKRMTKNNA